MEMQDEARASQQIIIKKDHLLLQTYSHIFVEVAD